MRAVTLSSIFFIMVIGLLSACMGGSPTPQDHYYRLAAVTAATNAAISLPYTEIGVPPATADGLYRDRPILFVDSHAPLELQQYHYYHWHTAPANLIQDQLIDWLQKHITNSRIQRLDPGEQSTLMLQTRIVHFERSLSDKGIGVLVELEMSLQQRHRLLHKQIYRQNIAVHGDTMHDTVQAFGVALTDIYARFLHNIRN